MDGTIALGAADKMALPKIPNFNAGEYLSKAISQLKAKTESAYVMKSNSKQSNAASDKIDFQVQNTSDGQTFNIIKGF